MHFGEMEVAVLAASPVGIPHIYTFFACGFAWVPKMVLLLVVTLR